MKSKLVACTISLNSVKFYYFSSFLYFLLNCNFLIQIFLLLKTFGSSLCPMTRYSTKNRVPFIKLQSVIWSWAVMVHASNPSSREAEAGGCLWFETSLKKKKSIWFFFFFKKKGGWEDDSVNTSACHTTWGPWLYLYVLDKLVNQEISSPWL